MRTHRFQILIPVLVLGVSLSIAPLLALLGLQDAIPALIIASIVVGWLLVRHTLRPVDQWFTAQLTAILDHRSSSSEPSSGTGDTSSDEPMPTSTCDSSDGSDSSDCSGGDAGSTD